MRAKAAKAIHGEGACAELWSRRTLHFTRPFSERAESQRADIFRYALVARWVWSILCFLRKEATGVPDPGVCWLDHASESFVQKCWTVDKFLHLFKLQFLHRQGQIEIEQL